MTVKHIASIVSLLLVLFSGCAKPSVQEIESERSKIDKMADETLKALLQKDPSIQKELDSAKGYGVVTWKLTKIPVFGTGWGYGVIVDLRNNERTYINVSRFDLGGGIGARSFKNLIIVQDEAILDEAKDGDIKFEAGAEVSAGTLATEGSHSADAKKRLTTHVLIDGGGSATATVRVMYSTLKDELNKD